MKQTLKCGMLAFMLSAAVTAAGPAETPRSVIATLTVNPDKCVIYGTALDVNATPLPHAAVRLRNLDTKTIEQTSTTNVLGEYVFIAFPDTAYVVEIADAPGRVIAVGDVISTRAGEIAGGVVIVPAATQAAGLFRNALGTVLSAVAGTGLTVLQAAPPLSPEK
jgi:hypothetical protein